MNNVILFKIGEDEFPIEIIDKDNQRWVTRKQLGNALGVSDSSGTSFPACQKKRAETGYTFYDDYRHVS